MKVRTVIVDDMPLARGRLRRHLASDPEIELVGEARNGKEAIELIERLAPDLLFLDVQMPEVGGFEVLESVGPDAVPAVVFVTAYDEFALRAFDVHALDYLLKPFDAERLATAVMRAKKQLAASQPTNAQLTTLLDELRGAGKYVTRFAVRSRERLLFVATDDIESVEGAGNYVRLHTGDASHLLRDRLSAIETKLDPELFVRVHRSTIVNVNRIREMRPLVNGDQLLVLTSGRRLTVSRTFRARLMSALAEPPLPSATMSKSRKAASQSEESAGVDPRFEPLVEAFADDPSVTRGKMMASYGLKVRGKIFAMLVRDDLVLKLPKPRVDALVAAGHGKPFQPRPGRAMKEWLVVDLPAAKWVELAREAYAFVSSAPAR
ncbi:MAG TPA: LytTR family transcriptional regulator DNA-binding domain-containing protein [Thermoanaerobaculia bacterium]|jgi:two-component system LytT family response regulator